MTMNSSGPISLAGTTAGVSIEIENGGNGTTQISLNDTAVRSLAGVTTPGSTIIMPTNFYGKSNQFSFAIASDTTNVNLRSAAVTAGWNQSSALVCTINSGVFVYSTSVGSYAMTVNGSFPGGVSLINNGVILGKGGAGGSYDTTGQSAGPALLVSSAVSITNASGNISGGGGGGGGGQSWTYCSRKYKSDPCSAYETVAGGGGGGGIGNGAAGSGTPPCGYTATAGTLTTAGSQGGPSGCGYYAYTGRGGAGGGYGAAGGTGTGPNGGCCGYGGGAGGAAVVGNSNITWVSTGTRNGSIS